jgi:hypothetical protein
MSNVPNVIWSEFRLAILSPQKHPLLLQRVPDIVSIGAEKQMADLYTGWSVAPVANNKTIRNRTIRNNPCDAMSKLGYWMSIGCEFSRIDSSVTSAVSAARPMSTAVCIHRSDEFLKSQR